MPTLPFIATHDGVSIKCAMTADKLLAVSSLQILEPRPADDRLRVWLTLRERAEFLSDLLHAGMPFELLATCRHARTAMGALIEGAWSVWSAAGDSLKSAEALQARSGEDA